MVKWYHSITTKLVVSFMVLVIAISGLTFVYTYAETQKSINNSLDDHLEDVARTMASQINATEVGTLTSLKPGDENTSGYLAIVQHLREMRNGSTSIINGYIMLVNGTQVTFLVDDAEDEPASIGYIYISPEPDKIQTALTESSASSKIYTDVYGSYMSGYAPVKDSDNRTVVVLGVDMDASTVLASENFIGSTIYVIMGLGVLIAGVIVGVLAFTIIRDIKKLNQTATKISMGDMDVSVDVKRKDEVGELASSFSRMVASLKFMMMSEQEDQVADKPDAQEKK